MSQSKQLPKGYEQIDHHDTFDLFNEEKGIVITIHELEPFMDGWEKFDYKVIGAKDQKGFYEGTFQSLSHAEDKVLELAEEH